MRCRTPPHTALHVDPKAFFAPGKTDWTACQDLISTYGNHDTLSIHPGWWLDQHDYAAIVLVNPPENSGAAELTLNRLARQAAANLAGRPG